MMHSSPRTKTRSSLTIDAVASAAAQGAATALLPHRRIGAIAGLAGFVLRLFRRSLTAPSGAGATISRRYPGAKAALERSRSGADTKPERSGYEADTKRERSAAAYRCGVCAAPLIAAARG